MKVLSSEEEEAHWRATVMGGLKGFVIGSVVSVGIVQYVKTKKPQMLKLPYSIKTAALISPPTLAMSLWGEFASNDFQDTMTKAGEQSQYAMAEHRRLKAMPWNEYLLEMAIKNKYTIIFGSWVASMWGSWWYINRDKLMTQSQKVVQARMYAQTLTVLLLLGSMGLTMVEEKKHPELFVVQDAFKDGWKDVLEKEVERTEKKKAEQAAKAAAAAADVVD